MPGRKIMLIGVFCCLFLLGRAEDERIWIEASVNDKPAQFIFDTGTPAGFVLFRDGAERLGLTVTNYASVNGVASSNDVYLGYTGEYSLKIREQSFQAWFLILDSAPAFAGFSSDGIFGWPSVTNCVVMIDAKTEMMQRFNTVPAYVKGWLKFPVEGDSGYLRLIIPKSDGKRNVLVVDTGSPMGVKLRPDLWRKWESTHKSQPKTISAGFMFGIGVVRSEEMWAKDFSFGTLSLTDVPVEEANSIDLAMGGPDFVATLGLAALKRLDLIVDAPHGVAYLRPKIEKAPPYNHSRLAAAFVPSNMKTNDWTAHVLKNGPAYIAGIRDNDVLLEVNGTKVEASQDLRKVADLVSASPSGTKITLKLKRGEKVFETSVVLRDIIGP